MPAPISYAMQRALGAQTADPVRDRAAAARSALDQLVGSMGVAPLSDVARTRRYEPTPMPAPSSGGYGGGYGVARSGGSGRFHAGLAAQVPSMFGLRQTSGYRSPARNAAVGGVPNSRHLSDRARDYSGSPEAMRAAAAWARANGADEVLIHNAGSGTHLHIGW